MFGVPEVHIEKERIEPDEGLAAYLIWYFTRSKELGKKATRQIFLNAARDYLDGHISSAVFSHVCSSLLHTFNNPSDRWDHELLWLLERCEDIDYYKGHQPTDDVSKLTGRLRAFTSGASFK